MNIFTQIVFFSDNPNSLDHLFVVHRSSMLLLFGVMGLLVVLVIALLTWIIVKRRQQKGRKAAYRRKMEEMREAAVAMARSEREAAWRTMARQIAHEINNPLTPMRLRIQQLSRLHNDEDERFDRYFRESVSLLIDQIDDLSRIATSFSTFAKVPIVRAESVDIAQKLSSVIALYRSNEYNIPIRYVGADAGVWAIADPEQIGEVFSNILKNAIQAMGLTDEGVENPLLNAANIIVTMSGVPNADGMLEISFSDNGPGIPEEIRDKVFLPNFTTKSTGAGLGLAISKNIVDMSGGQIDFTTSPKGTTFVVRLKVKN